MVLTLRLGRINMTTTPFRRLFINTFLNRPTILRVRSTITRTNKNRPIQSRRTNLTYHRLIMFLMSIILNSKIRHNNQFVRRRREHVLMRHANRRRPLNLPTKRLSTIFMSLPTSLHFRLFKRTLRLFNRTHFIRTIPSTNLISTNTTLNRILNRNNQRSQRVLRRHHRRLMVVPTIVQTSILPVRRSTTLNKVRGTTRRLSRHNLTHAIRTRSNRILTKTSNRIRLISNILLHTKMPMTSPFRPRLVKNIRPLFRQRTILGTRQFQVFRGFPRNKSIRALLIRFYGLFRGTTSPLNGANDHTRVRRRLQSQRALFRYRPSRMTVNHTITRRRRNRISSVNPRMNHLPPRRRTIMRPRHTLPRFFRPLSRTRSTSVLTMLPINNSLLRVNRPLRVPNFLLTITMTPLISPPKHRVTSSQYNTSRRTRPNIRTKRRRRMNPRTRRINRSLTPTRPRYFSKFVINTPNPIDLNTRVRRTLIRRIQMKNTNPLTNQRILSVSPSIRFSGRVPFTRVALRRNRYSRRRKGPTGSHRRSTRHRPLFRRPRRHQNGRRLHSNPTHHSRHRQRTSHRRHPVSTPPYRTRRVNHSLPRIMF